MPRGIYLLKALPVAAWFAGSAAMMTTGSAMASGDNGSSEALRAYLTSPELPETMFSPRLLTKVPVEEMRRSRDEIRTNFGDLCSISPLRVHMLQHLDRGTIQFEGGALDVKVILDAQGRIDELLFFNPVLMNGDVDGAIQAISQLPGQASLVITEGGKIVGSHQPDHQAHVPDFEPIALLGAVQAAVTSNRLGWDTAVPWRKEWIVGGSRVLAGWPVGHPLTVRSLMNFALQNEESAMRALNDVLASVGSPPPEEPPALSPAELCQRFGALNDDGGLSVWEGPATTLGWDRVKYKGGGTATTINHTIAMQSGGRNVCISATWENQLDGVSALLFWRHMRTLSGVMLKNYNGCSPPNS